MNKKLKGGILIAVGILVAGVGGLCSLEFLVLGAFRTNAPAPGIADVIITVGLWIASGFILLFAGITQLRGDE
jgi:hypothetical protein